MTPTYATLVLLPLLAVLAPLATRVLRPWVSVPIVVFELALGIVAGPAVLGWVAPDAFFGLLSQFGLAMLFFVAGTEIEFAELRGRAGNRALAGWLVSFVLGLCVGFVVAPGLGAVVVAVALASTALGTLLPILRDAGELRTPFGTAVGALGAIGEFGPLLVISILLGSRQPGPATLVLGGFAVVAFAAVVAALRIPRGALHRAVSATLHTSGQFAVRVLMLLLAALVVLSLLLKIDMLLGAFAAGIVWRLLMRDADPRDRDAVESKIEGLAFGFLVPLFFVTTGVSFDLQALLSDPVLLALVPVAVLALLVVRGLPSVLAAPSGASMRTKAAVGLMGATGLPIIVAATSIGVKEGFISGGAGAVLVGAGMLSVLLFPLIAMAVRGGRRAHASVETLPLP